MWLVYALLASLSYAVLGLMMRSVSVKSKDPRVFGFMFSLFATACLVVWTLVTSSFRVSVISTYLVVLFVVRVVSGAIFQRYQFIVRKHIEASVVQLILTPTIVSGYMLSLLWLGEPASLTNIIGLCLIVLGGMLIVYKKGKFRLNKYVLITIFIGVCLSIAATIDKRTLIMFPLPLYMTLAWLAGVVILYFPSVSMKQLKTEWRLNTWKIPLLVALNIAGMIFNLVALKLGLASQVNPVLATTLILIVVGGILFLNERDRIVRKLLAAAVAYIGLILIAL